MNTENEHQPERTLWSGHQSHWYFCGHWLVGLFIVAPLAVGIYFYRFDLSQWMPWVYGVPVVALLVVVVVVAFAHRLRTYRVTSRRVIADFGRVVKDTNELRIQDIRSMNVSKSGLTGLLGVGKIEFSSAATDDADVIFYQIGGVNKVRDLVRSLQD
jgi:uncharacterized membrane protein YdbT with pleckstrin-like domain